VKKLIIIGFGGHGKVVAEAASLLINYNDILFLDSNYPNCSDERVVGHSDNFKNYIQPNVEFIVAIGDCSIRLFFSNEINACGGKLAIIVHPKAILSNKCSLGAGTFVGPLAVVNSGAKIGSSCIINTGAIVEHDCELGDGVHLSPNASIAGNVNIKNQSWIGIGATVINNISIGESVIIGAGAVVLKNVADSLVVVGNPARKIKQNKNDR